MPLDPSISLDVTGGRQGVGAGGQGSNPLELVGNIAATQERLNQIKLFNQTFQARQAAGQILATAPDLDSGIKELQRNPLTSAFAPELAASAASTAATLTGRAGAQQQQGFDAFHQLVGGLPAVLQDKTQWPALTGSVLQLTSPEARPQVAKSMQYLQSALNDPMPDGSPVTQVEMNKRLAGWSIAGGFGDAVPRILGAPGAQTIGGATVPTITAPAQGGVGGEAPGTITPVGGAEAEASSAPDTFHTADGTPLKLGSSPSIGKGLLGQKALTPAQQTAASTRMAEWNGPELHAFQSAQMTQGLLGQMSADYDQMAKAGGMLVPGTGAGFRTAFAKTVNTIYQALEPNGEKTPPFDPSAIASAENMTKATRTMGLSVLTTMLGNQREAAQTIHDITQAVPAINNSYLGGKVLIDTIGAATQRAIDQRNFENAWQAKNQGNLQGADEAFAAQAPMTQYTSKVLEKYGIGSDGFKSPEAIRSAAHSGYLTPKQATELLVEQFPSQFHSKGK